MIASRGDVTFNLRGHINVPNNVIEYVSLNELCIANTNYDIYAHNNTLVLRDYLGVSQPIMIPQGNYTVSSLMKVLNTAFADAVGTFKNI